MTVVEITLRVEIDSDDEKQIENIVESITENANLSYTRIIDLDGTNLEEKEYVLHHELVNHDIIS